MRCSYRCLFIYSLPDVDVRVELHDTQYCVNEYLEHTHRNSLQKSLDPPVALKYLIRVFHSFGDPSSQASPPFSLHEPNLPFNTPLLAD